MGDIPPPPIAVPWIVPHPKNGTTFLTDKAASILWLCRIDCGISKLHLPVVFSLMYLLFFDDEPPLSLLPSGSTLELADRRLCAQDESLMLQERRVLVANTKTGAYRHYHTKEQLQLQAKQGRELSHGRHSPDAMNDISGCRSFIGSLKAADKISCLTSQGL